MDFIDHIVEDLARQFATMTVAEQRQHHLRVTNLLLRVASVRQVHAVLHHGRMAQVCEWLGPGHREQFENLIEGHLALRQLGCFTADGCPR